MSEVGTEFVALTQTEDVLFGSLCARFGISGPTSYKWLRRYAAEGAAGLANRTRRPQRSPGRTFPEVEQAVPAGEGLKSPPAACTITAILQHLQALDAAPTGVTLSPLLDDHSRYALQLGACPT